MADTNKIVYGLSKCYYAVATIDSNGAATYSSPVAIPGAVNLAMSAQGETNPFYADNIVYYTSISNSGYEGTLEVAKLPDSFFTAVLGYKTGANGVLYEDADAEPVHFALLFQFEGDAKAKRSALYNCVAQRPDVGSSTKEASIKPNTETVNITATTVKALGTDIVKGSVVEGDSAYSNWFTAVTLPTAAATT